MLAWLRWRKLLRLLKFYGIPKDEEDVRIERIDWCIIGGLLVIYRALQTEALIDGTLSVALFANEHDQKNQKNEDRLAEKDEQRQRQRLRDLQDGMVEIFNHALIKPDPKTRDMRALAANPDIGAQLYGRILAHSFGKKKPIWNTTRTKE